MVVHECEMMDSHQAEVDSSLLQPNQQHNIDDHDDDNNNNNNNKNLNTFSSIGRQSSIYSLTLDEFQQSLCESGKNFGSMNMDEFLNSIWSAEENQAINSNNNSNNNNNNNNNLSLRKQPSLPRQGSLTIPAPLCRKTVDEVWSEIHKGQQSQQQQQHHHQNNNNNSGVRKNNGSSGVQNNESAPRQPTFGEMTLEDFLVKAGVVREPCAMHLQQPPHPLPPHHQQHQHGVYSTNNSTMGPSFVGRPVIGIVGARGGVAGGNMVGPPYQAVPQGGGAIGEHIGYAGNGKRDGGYPPLPGPAGVCFGGRLVNGGGGGYAAVVPHMGMAGVAPVSPISSDGIGTSENSGGQFGMEMGVVRGRKRVLDGPVEKVVERRQRRMIKNRESAARSRARKQAYTVELEAELNQLREENTQLKQALVELERRRKQQCFEEMNVIVQTKAQKAMKKLRSLRRNLSCSL